MEMIIIYPVFIGMAVATAQLAYERGYSSRWWFLWGILLPVLAPIILFMMKKRPKSQTGYHAPVVKEVKDKVIFKRSDG